jgi:rhodanese-related sulfurtransferase
MPRLLEFIRHHPYLIAAAVIILLLFIGDELWRRLRKYRELPPVAGVLLINKGAAVLDIRPSKEFGAGHVIGARNIPFAELQSRMTELDKFREQPLIVYCDAGQTSHKAANLLTKNGFKAVHTLKGGIKAWQIEHLPLERGERS